MTCQQLSSGARELVQILRQPFTIEFEVVLHYFCRDPQHSTERKSPLQ